MITRYRQRPPEVDALRLTVESFDDAVRWLAAFGRDAYVEQGALRVMPGTDGVPGFEVHLGEHLVRSITDGTWAPVPEAVLIREYSPVARTPQPWDQRYGSGAAPRPETHDLRRVGFPTALDRPLGQPGGGL